MNPPSEEILRGCLKFDRNAQRVLFEEYSPAMMEICIRYAKNQEEARDMLLHGFRNIFATIRQFAEANVRRKSDQPVIDFFDWIKREIILAAVYFMHHKKKEASVSSTFSTRESDRGAEEVTDDKIIQHADKEYIVRGLQQLSTLYRTVYNMHEVDGYTHPEISRLLDVSEYLSKDALSKAKFNLRRNLIKLLPKKS